MSSAYAPTASATCVVHYSIRCGDFSYPGLSTKIVAQPIPEYVSQTKFGHGIVFQWICGPNVPTRGPGIGPAALPDDLAVAGPSESSLNEQRRAGSDGARRINVHAQCGRLQAEGEDPT